jgi:hypothetical protein
LLVLVTGSCECCSGQLFGVETVRRLLRGVGTYWEGSCDGLGSARILEELLRSLGDTYSWYDPKPFWYLYFSGVVNFVRGMLRVFANCSLEIED